MQKQVIIIIPIYKPVADKYEEISFRQCIKILSKHPISIVTFKELNTDWYENLLKEAAVDFFIEYFDADYFKSTSGYSQLMTSKEFYHRFSTYKYMLLYQLDAYVFNDELDYWCKQGYDYIGAPWFNGWNAPTKEITGVGNGGFSLRKIETFRKAHYMFIKPRTKIKEYLHALGLLVFGKNEDIVIHRFGKAGRLKIPSEQEALGFAFDTHPALSFRMNGEKLPFGCHAWGKNKVFWDSYILNSATDLST